MNNRIKTGLFSVILTLTLLVVVYFVSDFNISFSSSDIEFSPGQASQKTKVDSSVHKPKNIIVFIADGMGFGHLSLALHTLQAENKPLIWQEFEVKGWHDARSVIGPLTDSEASATAIATGTSTNFGHIGIDANGNHLKNIFELATEFGYTTGIVTDSYIWDGTPAAFTAHTRNEDDARDILAQIASGNLDLLFGELEDLGEGDVPEKEETMEIISRRFQLLDKTLKLPNGANTSIPVAAIYNEDEVQDLNSSPNLTRLTEVALDYMSSQNNPFILLVECEELDAASHENDSERVLNGLRSIQQTLSLVLDYSKTNRETLVVFTSDHETGGFTPVSDFNTYPRMQVRWSTKNHTAFVVPLFADGPGARSFADVHRNWEIGYLLKKLILGENEANPIK